MRQTVERSGKAPKRVYTKPRLTVYGDLTRITQNQGTNASDHAGPGTHSY